MWHCFDRKQTETKRNFYIGTNVILSQDKVTRNSCWKQNESQKNILETPGNKNPEIGNKVPSSGNTKKHFHGYNGIVIHLSEHWFIKRSFEMK